MSGITLVESEEAFFTQDGAEGSKEAVVLG